MRRPRLKNASATLRATSGEPSSWGSCRVGRRQRRSCIAASGSLRTVRRRRRRQRLPRGSRSLAKASVVRAPGRRICAREPTRQGRNLYRAGGAKRVLKQREPLTAASLALLELGVFLLHTRGSRPRRGLGFALAPSSCRRRSTSQPCNDGSRRSSTPWPDPCRAAGHVSERRGSPNRHTHNIATTCNTSMQTIPSATEAGPNNN